MRISRDKCLLFQDQSCCKKEHEYCILRIAYCMLDVRFVYLIHVLCPKIGFSVANDRVAVDITCSVWDENSQTAIITWISSVYPCDAQIFSTDIIDSLHYSLSNLNRLDNFILTSNCWKEDNSDCDAE